MDTVIPHTHNGVDSPKIKSGDVISVSNSIPTHSAKEGTLILYFDGVSTYQLYVRINQTWKSTTLT